MICQIIINMNINIISIGKLKENYLKLMQDEYLKRISKFAKINIYELKEEELKDESDINIEKAKTLEGTRILEQIDKIKDTTKIIYLLCIEGKEYNTIELKDEINKNLINGISTIIFVIGGSYGISDDVKNKYKNHLSFSKLTFPHQVFRCMLLEQVYRVFKIINNEPYHK